MNKKYFNIECPAGTSHLRYVYAKGGLGALIRPLWKDYVMSEARFDDDD